MTSEEVPEVPEKITHRTEPVEIVDEMKTCFIDYAMSVIIGRAIPDVRDGLKPVHRRILYAMYHDENNTSDKPYKKSAKAVAATMGNYHPHGDAAIYDTLVKMAQPFSMRCPLVDGQGNFGSIDGDSAAAMRYTEARLTKPAESLLEDIDKDTVDFVPNFDETTPEPDVLPSKIPNLLVNGTTGIAVGMATNMMPHNLGEVCTLVNAYIDKPDMSVDEMMEIMPGPDFPTGGIIMGTDGVKNAYLTGKGKVIVRGVTEVEERRKGYEQIVITEIPYQVNKSVMIEKIAALVKEKIIDGISDIRDESDKDGIRIVIELKQNVSGQVVLNLLYKHTQLENSYGITNLAIVNKKPAVLSLEDLLRNFIGHRSTVVRRRSEFDLNKAKARVHILEGFMKAIDLYDEIVKLIHDSADSKASQEALVSAYGFTEVQAEAILNMQLRRLSALERQKISDETDELNKVIRKLNWILESEEHVLSVVKDETKEVSDAYADERRTKIDLSPNRDFEITDFIDNKQEVVILTSQDYIKRVPLEVYRQQRRGGRGVTGITTKDEDSVDIVFSAMTHDSLLCFTNKGRLYWLKVYEIPEGTRTSKGRAIVNLLNITDQEISAVIPIHKFEKDKFLFYATKNGRVGKFSEALFSKPHSCGVTGMTLLDNDELVNVIVTDGNSDVLLTSAFGQALRISEKIVRATGRGAQGVRGMKFKHKDDHICAITPVDDNGYVVMVTDKGFGKRTRFDKFPTKGRGGIGVKAINASKERGKVVCAVAASKDDDLIISTAAGIVMRTTVSNITIQGRASKGVRVIKPDKGDTVKSVAVVSESENDK